MLRVIDLEIQEVINKMPKVRLYGNIFLSFLTKFRQATGSYLIQLMDLLLLKKELINQIPLHKLDNRFFFETDLLFRIGLLETFIIEIPIQAVYENEKSNLNSIREILIFL